jgi:hypothetical protein
LLLSKSARSSRCATHHAARRIALRVATPSITNVATGCANGPCSLRELNHRADNQTRVPAMIDGFAIVISVFAREVLVANDHSASDAGG